MSKRTNRPRILYRLLLVFAGLMVAGVGTTWYLYRTYVVLHPGEHLSRADILRRISSESPVYFRDGKHKVGVFFGAEHRQYVPYRQLPQTFINAIVSAEDKNFFHHHGVDPRGIARAMLANIKAGRIVAGGSTITQQTAKNLYYRNERTWAAKWQEFVNALRLEAHYSKEEILEFYVNQFHVHANGRGLGIAARYFFDKDVKDLTPLECAFLAGVVKGPFRYNPFVGRTEEKRAQARARARRRTHYVIDRMLANGYLTPEEARRLKEQELHFKKGEFRYEQSVILDYVFDRIQGEQFAPLLQEHGIDNPVVAGIKVYTTIDREMQAAAEYGLRHTLTEVGARLEGFDLSAFFAEQETISPIVADEVEVHRFYHARVSEKNLEGKGGPTIQVDLGGVPCTVDRKALKRVADLLVQARNRNTWSHASRAKVQEVARRIPPDQNVLVSVRTVDPEGTLTCDLEARPELQGAVVVLDRGRIRAMVGGQENRNFNRATNALRQFGSTFKPLTYAAARTLGWGTLDPLDNRRQGFYFQRQWYWPRPDHQGTTPYVSMVQAGTKSENVASVSLLYHLTDRLNEEQLIDLAHRVGMAPAVAESTTDYARRIQDKYGIFPDDDTWAEGLFDQLRRGLAVELAFSDRNREKDALDHLMYGRGFDAEIKATRSIRDSKERAARYHFLDRGFLQLETLAPQALADANTLLATLPPEEPDRNFPDSMRKVLNRAFGLLSQSTQNQTSETQDTPSPESVNQALQHFHVITENDAKRLVYSKRGRPDWPRATREEVLELLTGRPMSPRTETNPDAGALDDGREREPRNEDPDPDSASLSPRDEPEEERPVIDPARLFRRAERLSGRKQRREAPDPAEVILLEDTISPATVRDIREALDQRLETTPKPPRYDLKRLVHNREFRVMLGLQYLIQMVRAMGVESELRPVLSMTLGSNEVTLLEAALAYQTFLQGNSFGFHGQEPEAAIIERIEDVEGQTIYQLAEQRHRVFAPMVGPSIGRILRQVVTHGTGRRARDAVRVASSDPTEDARLARDRFVVPLFGKTGTTNSYTNTAFIGFVPAPHRRGPSLPYGQALTVAVYVGYDDNRPMKRGSIRAHGASGALPAWIETAQGVVRDLDLPQLIVLEALNPGETVPIEWPRDMAAIAIDATTGLRTGTGILLPEEEVPEGCLSYEVYGVADRSGWRERDAYVPFTPWGQRPRADFSSELGTIRTLPLGELKGHDAPGGLPGQP